MGCGSVYDLRLDDILGCRYNCLSRNYSSEPVTGSSEIRPFTELAINPITAPDCKIFGLKDARTHLQTVYFSLVYHLLSTLCVSMKILSHNSAKITTETINGFKICTFIGRFQVI